MSYTPVRSISQESSQPSFCFYLINFFFCNHNQGLLSSFQSNSHHALQYSAHSLIIASSGLCVKVLVLHFHSFHSPHTFPAAHPGDFMGCMHLLIKASSCISVFNQSLWTPCHHRGIILFPMWFWACQPVFCTCVFDSSHWTQHYQGLTSYHRKKKIEEATPIWHSGDNQSVGSSVPVVRRWLWPINRTFLEWLAGGYDLEIGHF